MSTGPRLYPEDPTFPADGDAERAVWESLRDQLPDDAVLFAGVHLLDGPDEREIDVLVAWPGVGLAVLEVKGGHITRHYADPLSGIEAVQLEISQRCYMDEDSFAYDEAKATQLHAVLWPLMQAALA